MNHMKQYESRNSQHYHLNCVSSAKPRVDNGAPKSMSLSQKRRDVILKKSNSTPRTKSASATSRHYKSVENLHGPITSQSFHLPLYDDFEPARSSAQNKLIPINSLRNSYDPLNYHQHYFTQPSKPFTPRINSYAPGTTSALKHYKDAYDYEPAEHNHSNDNRPYRNSNESNGHAMVPRLNIGSGTERGRGGGVGYESQEQQGAEMYTYRDWMNKMEKMKLEKELKERLTKQSDSIIDQMRHSHDFEKSKHDEESKYLEFVREVTADIIRRNISANSVIKQVFEWHIEQNKDQLDEDKMRAHLTPVSRQLGLMDSDVPFEGSTTKVPIST